jgi:hypothetical protein
VGPFIAVVGDYRPERLVEAVSGHELAVLVAVDIDPVEDRLVECLPTLVVTQAVELLWFDQ